MPFIYDRQGFGNDRRAFASQIFAMAMSLLDSLAA